MTMKRLEHIIDSRWFQFGILAVICANAAVLGLQTSPMIAAACNGWLERIDKWCIVVFTVEIALKLAVYRWRFWCSAWNLFDFAVVAVSLVPDMGMFSLARLFRVLRVFRLVSGVRHLRIIISAILKSIPGVSWAGLLLLLVYYVYGIIGTNLFGAVFPDWFGTLGKSVYSLFQVMTLESWSMGIARPVMAAFPYAWVFFVTYILISSFIVMNIVVGIVLNSIGDCFKNEASDDAVTTEDAIAELEKLKRQVEVVEKTISKVCKAKK